MADIVHIEVTHLDATGGEWVVAYFRHSARKHLDEGRFADVWSPDQSNLQTDCRSMQCFYLA